MCSDQPPTRARTCLRCTAWLTTVIDTGIHGPSILVHLLTIEEIGIGVIDGSTARTSLFQVLFVACVPPIPKAEPYSRQPWIRCLSIETSPPSRPAFRRIRDQMVPNPIHMQLHMHSFRHRGQSILGTATSMSASIFQISIC